jgi:hypothetical protein
MHQMKVHMLRSSCSSIIFDPKSERISPDRHALFNAIDHAYLSKISYHKRSG